MRSTWLGQRFRSQSEWIARFLQAPTYLAHRPEIGISVSLYCSTFKSTCRQTVYFLPGAILISSSRRSMRRRTLKPEEGVVKVRELMTESLVSVESEETVTEAGKLMSQRGISSVLVERQGEILGIITDRDIITRVVAKGLDATKVGVTQVMTSPLITIEDYASLDEAAKKMAEYSVRRLVVERAHQKVGIISESDMLRVDSELHFLIRERTKLEAKMTPAEPQGLTLAGFCEECGNYSARLRKVDGQWLDDDCRD
jgi:CBS domain-containing protein